MNQQLRCARLGCPYNARMDSNFCSVHDPLSPLQDSPERGWPYEDGRRVADYIVAVMIVVTLVLLVLVFCRSSHAAGYPDRPVRLIVAYPPGGGTDIVTRYMQAKWQERRGWHVIVDNRAGATGMIGTDIASRSAPDGYTLLMGHIAPNAINPGDFIEPRVQPEWKLAPVALVAVAPSLLLVRPTLGVRSVKELRALLKGKRPLYASDGIGSLAHLQMEWFLAGQHKEQVPYKGGGPALQGFLAGDAPVMFSPAPVALPWVKQGKAIALAQTTNKRIASLPEVPTMVEAGEPGFEAPLWWALFAPAGTPRAVVELWNKETNAVLAEPAVRAWFENQGYAAQPMGVDEFAAFVREEKRKWAAITRRVTP